MKKALIFYGGWSGHDPERVSRRFEGILARHGFAVDRTEGLEVLAEGERLLSYDLIVPCYTMGTLPHDCEKNVSYAVSRGTGLAGCHGGMCDAFRNSTEWQFITGGQWVSHPGNSNVTYTVSICHGANPITDGIVDFSLTSEQYYLHVDPAVEVLATTQFPIFRSYHAANKPIDMPVAWTKYWGLGRVFYCSIGHNDAVFDACPSALTLIERGMLWAAEGKRLAKENGLDASSFENGN